MTSSPTLTKPKSERIDPANAESSTALDKKALSAFRKDFTANPSYRMARNAVTQVKVDDVALNRGIITATDHTFSHKLDDWHVTNQKKSGRCWMFAALNLFRVGTKKKMNLKEFEFSQNYNPIPSRWLANRL